MNQILSRRSSAFFQFIGGKFFSLMGLAFCLSFLVYAMELLLAYAIQSIFTSHHGRTAISSRLPTWLNLSDLRICLVFIIGVVVVRSAAQWTNQIVSSTLSDRFVMKMRKSILDSAFDRQSATSSETSFFFLETALSARTALVHLQTVLYSGALSLLFSICLIYLSPLLASVGCLGILFVLSLQKKPNRRLAELGRSMRMESTHALSVMSKSLRNLILIRLHHLEDEERKTAKRHVEQAYAYSRKAQVISSFLPVSSQVLGAGLAILLVLFSRKIPSLSAGATALFVYFFMRFSQSMSQVSAAFSKFLIEKPALIQLFERWRIDKETVRVELRLPADHPLAGKKRVSSPIGWRASRVTFKYPTSAWILENASFSISPGRIYSIAGPSGSGKSTVLDLLLGELSPSGGEIQVILDGHAAPILEVRSLLLDHVGYAGPEPFLIAGSIYDNLTFGLGSPPEPCLLEEMLELAQCQFIRELPKGLHHEISEQGIGLSAGQKQRIGLLRAFLRQSKALILDEATCHLDYTLESKILEALPCLREQMTILLVSHRPHVLRIGENLLQLPLQKNADPPLILPGPLCNA